MENLYSNINIDEFTQTFPCASNLLSRCKSIFATLILPYLAAICKGVKPFLVVALREALFSTRIVAT